MMAQGKYILWQQNESCPAETSGCCSTNDTVHEKVKRYARRKMKKEEKVKLQKPGNHSHHLKLRPHT